MGVEAPSRMAPDPHRSIRTPALETARHTRAPTVGPHGDSGSPLTSGGDARLRLRVPPLGGSTSPRLAAPSRHLGGLSRSPIRPR